MTAKQRYQLISFVRSREDRHAVRRHNTGIEMELRTPPGSFVCLLNFWEFLDYHDGVSGLGFSHGDGRGRDDLLMSCFSRSPLFSINTRTRQDSHSIASCAFRTLLHIKDPHFQPSKFFKSC